MNILLDCDGVLADFVSASIRVHGQSLAHDEVTDWEYFREWGLSSNQFWKPLRGREFWYEQIKPYPWAPELLSKLSALGDVTILTAPSADPECPAAKIEWLGDRLGIGMDQILVGRRKYLCARPDSVLIDDSHRTVARFKEWGGHAIEFPQPWNSSTCVDWRDVVSQVAELHRQIA